MYVLLMSLDWEGNVYSQFLCLCSDPFRSLPLFQGLPCFWGYLCSKPVFPSSTTFHCTGCLGIPIRGCKRIPIPKSTTIDNPFFWPKDKFFFDVELTHLFQKLAVHWLQCNIEYQFCCFWHWKGSEKNFQETKRAATNMPFELATLRKFWLF